jgi:hypothetical protein
VLQMIIEEINESTGVSVNKWYLDDGIAGGDEVALTKVWEILTSPQAKNLGLDLQSAKCEIIVITNNAKTIQAARNMQVIMGIAEQNMHMDGNFELLGTPIGSETHMANFIESKIIENEEIAMKIASLQDKQCASLMLQYCTGFCKINHLMRTIPVFPKITQQLEKHQIIMRKAWQHVLGIDFTDNEWQQMELPTRFGGMGERNPVEHHAVAYTASITSAMILDVWAADEEHLRQTAADVSLALDMGDKEKGSMKQMVAKYGDIQDKLKYEPRKSYTGQELIPLKLVDPQEQDDIRKSHKKAGTVRLSETPKLQTHMSAWVNLKKFYKLYMHYTGGQSEAHKTVENRKHDHALLMKALLLPGAGAFIKALPKYGRMSKQELSIAVRLRLSTQVGYVLDPKCSNECTACDTSKIKVNGVLDQRGRHALVCKGTGHINWRHNRVRDLVFDEFRKTGKRVSKEQAISTNGDNTVAADVFVHNGAEQGKHLAMDVSIVYAVQKAIKGKNALQTNEAPEGMVAVTTGQKNKKHKLNTEQSNTTVFTPLVANHLGGFELKAFETLREVAIKACVAKGIRNPTSVYFMRRISVAIQKANADAICSRKPTDFMQCNMLMGGDLAEQRFLHSSNSHINVRVMV